MKQLHYGLILTLLITLALAGCSGGRKGSGARSTIYTAGCIDDGSNTRACFWTNTSAIPTCLGPAGTESNVNSICVQ